MLFFMNPPSLIIPIRCVFTSLDGSGSPCPGTSGNRTVLCINGRETADYHVRHRLCMTCGGLWEEMQSKEDASSTTARPVKAPKTIAKAESKLRGEQGPSLRPFAGGQTTESLTTLTMAVADAPNKRGTRRPKNQPRSNAADAPNAFDAAVAPDAPDAPDAPEATDAPPAPKKRKRSKRTKSTAAASSSSVALPSNPRTSLVVAAPPPTGPILFTDSSRVREIASVYMHLVDTEGIELKPMHRKNLEHPPKAACILAVMSSADDAGAPTAILMYEPGRSNSISILHSRDRRKGHAHQLVSAFIRDLPNGSRATVESPACTGLATAKIFLKHNFTCDDNIFRCHLAEESAYIGNNSVTLIFTYTATDKHAAEFKEFARRLALAKPEFMYLAEAVDTTEAVDAIAPAMPNVNAPRLRRSGFLYPDTTEAPPRPPSPPPVVLQARAVSEYELMNQVCVAAGGRAFPERTLSEEEAIRSNFKYGDSAFSVCVDGEVDDARRLAEERMPMAGTLASHESYQKLRETLREAFGYECSGYEAFASTRAGLPPQLALACKTPVWCENQTKDVRVVTLCPPIFPRANPGTIESDYFRREGQLNNLELFGYMVQMFMLAFDAVRTFNRREERDDLVLTIPQGNHEYPQEYGTVQQYRKCILFPAIHAARARFPDIQIEMHRLPAIPNCFFGDEPYDSDDRVFVNFGSPHTMIGRSTVDRTDGQWGQASAIALLCWPRSNIKMVHVTGTSI